MSRFFPPMKWLAAGVVSCAFMMAAVVSASAQDGAPPPGAPAAKAPAAKADGEEAPPAKIPAAVLSGLLVGAPEALLALKQYLAQVSKSPEAVTRRALDVVRQIKESGLVRDPALMIAAAERVSRSAADTLKAIKIIELKVDRNYRPRAGTIALDFAPPDARLRPGFRRVLPGDSIVQGKQMQAIRRPGDDEDLLADGITGVEKVELDVPDGQYRVTLMTESLGDVATSLSPFGEQIIANGQAINVVQATPDAWLKQSVLSNSGLAGFNTATSRQGGAVTLNVTVRGGKLNLGFNQGAGAGVLKTYLTGMLVEPAAAPTSLSVAPDIEESLFTPQAAQDRYESQLASSVATLLDEVSPSAGPAAESDIFKPVQTVQQASPS